MHKYIFSVGNTIDPAEGYHAFRGRDARVEALMKKRGFPTEDAKTSKSSTTSTATSA